VLLGLNLFYSILKPQVRRPAISLQIGDPVKLIKGDSQSYQCPTNGSMIVTTVYSFDGQEGNLIGCRWQELKGGEVVNRTNLFPGSWLAKIQDPRL
jgi:hypothetical protein